ncbi:hypothetical protein GCM10027275_50890 [Rhabdobacter roseus]|uniref:Lipoprotein n=1 Tax=Rhabdobacter roseus TaxID=1655419 RepID=A0A840TZU6_9BACT|nr:hypothetical protein [Rhabdobacter roseus]MBB5287162.1 hypothetical protein [Rhabdobacter roseus]
MNYVLKPVSLFVLLLLGFACKKEEEARPPGLDSLEGTYVGYRSSSLASKAATDSVQVTLTVSQLAPGQFRILQTSPNEFEYIVTMRDDQFTYDKGLGEDACGVTKLTGQGYFRHGALYLIETIQCTAALSAPTRYIQFRAQKKP